MMNSSRNNMNFNDDDNIDSTIGNAIFFGNDESSSLGGSSNGAYLDGIFDRSTSFDVELESDPKLSLTRKSSALQRTLSQSTMLVESNEEKENDADTIRDDIMFVRHKASILQRASHILLQQQRDYHKVASYHACIEETRRNPVNAKISIWDEARYFLQSENDSPDEIGMGAANHETIPSATQSEFHSVTASMKSLSAVQQYCVANRSDQTQSVAAVSSAAKPLIAEPDSNDVQLRISRNTIDTSNVQCVTSAQYDTAAAVPRPLNEQFHQITNTSVNANTGSNIVDHWYSPTSENFSYPVARGKKRKCHPMEPFQNIPAPSRTTRIADRMNHERDHSHNHRGPNNDSIPLRETRANIENVPLLPFYELLLSFNKQKKEHEDWKLLHQAATRSNSCRSM
jgi:hypothetical protein